MLRAPPAPAFHPWRFFRTGGLVQAKLQTAEDLLALRTLDEKLWVALSCPVKGLQLDERTLALIDTDRDGHIHVPEVLEAVEWAAARLKHPADLLKGAPALSIDAISDAGEDTRVLASSAREILKRLGKPDVTELSPDDFLKPERIFPSTTLNGDGVLAPSESDDAEIQALLKDIVACVGGEKDRSGTDGVTPEKAAAFFDQLTAYLEWVAKSAGKDIAVLGEHTAAACAAVAAVRNKIEDFFARCRLSAFDVRALAALNRQEAEYLALAAKDLDVTSQEIAAFPVARVTPDGPLPLLKGVNPAWAGALATLHRDAVTPVFGEEKQSLTAEEWQSLNARLSPYETWLGRKVGTCIEQIGVNRAREILAGDVRKRLEALFAADKKLQPECDAISSVERLVRYHRDLRSLLHNFVNFADFYSRDRWANFQAGKLYLDSRTCELCIQVDDPNVHAALATMSKAYVAYLDCHRGTDAMKIAACFTQGDSDYLFVGRNGLFYDRQGRDWHATITKIIENPISMREAFWAPYKKVIRTVEEQIAQRASAAETASVANLATATTKPAQSAPPRKLDLSSIIGLSVALGSIGTFLATVFTKFVDLPTWEWPLVVVLLMLTISLPSVLIAWMKLRQRNLGPILEANGWAINGRVKINIPFGTALTERVKLPPQARVASSDPYASGHPVRDRVIIYGILAIFAAALLLVARAERTWPFAPAVTEKAALSRALLKPIGNRPPAGKPAAPAKK
ncbi:MAG TPA: hypothetical protein VHE61_22270 [Opitutaceae bacterium]|nr:hypothetical protein [Opitutaceae bacterium]